MIRTPSRRLVYGSLFVGLLFAIVPLPDAINPARPYLLGMLIVYWLMEAPLLVGMGTAFLAGVLADLTSASLLGEQALRLVVMAFLVQRFRARLRFFPLWQQAAGVGLLLLNDRVVVALIRLVTGGLPLPLLGWLAPVLAMVLWPWLFVLIDMARLRVRERG